MKALAEILLSEPLRRNDIPVQGTPGADFIPGERALFLHLATVLASFEGAGKIEGFLWGGGGSQISGVFRGKSENLQFFFWGGG
jgi:hypothetical protein